MYYNFIVRSTNRVEANWREFYQNLYLDNFPFDFFTAPTQERLILW